MEITAQMVKELRESTGAGMMDCKKILVETDGDIDKAIELLLYVMKKQIFIDGNKRTSGPSLPQRFFSYSAKGYFPLHPRR